MMRFGAGTGALVSFGLDGGEVVARFSSAPLAEVSPLSQWERERRAGPSKGEALAGRNAPDGCFMRYRFGSRRVAGGVSHSPIRASISSFPRTRTLWTNSNLTHPFLQRTIRLAFHCSTGHQHQSSTRATIDPGLAVDESPT
jgi:hypothetical protein